MGELTEKQKRFAHEYLVDLNAAAAARRAGYVENYGRELRGRPEMEEYIGELMGERAKRCEVTADRVMKELCGVAFSSIGDYVAVEEDGGVTRVTVKSTDDIPADKLAAVVGIREGTRGIEVKLADKLRALELLGKHLGMFAGKEEEPTDEPFQVNIRVVK